MHPVGTLLSHEATGKICENEVMQLTLEGHMMNAVYVQNTQPDLTAICTYFKKWLICTHLYDLSLTNS